MGKIVEFNKKNNNKFDYIAYSETLSFIMQICAIKESFNKPANLKAVESYIKEVVRFEKNYMDNKLDSLFNKSIKDLASSVNEENFRRINDPKIDSKEKEDYFILAAFNEAFCHAIPEVLNENVLSYIVESDKEITKYFIKYGFELKEIKKKIIEDNNNKGKEKKEEKGKIINFIKK